MVKVFVADSIGSVIAEKAADCMELSLQKAIDERGWRHTNRFSPGYCGWHVSQQQMLFPPFRRGASVRRKPYRLEPYGAHQVGQRRDRHRSFGAQARIFVRPLRLQRLLQAPPQEVVCGIFSLMPCIIKYCVAFCYAPYRLSLYAVSLFIMRSVVFYSLAYRLLLSCV